MATNKKQIKAFVSDDIKSKFTYIAAKENRSESNLMELLAIKHIEEYEASNSELIIDENGNVYLSNKFKPTVQSSSSKTG